MLMSISQLSSKSNKKIQKVLYNNPLETSSIHVLTSRDNK